MFCRKWLLTKRPFEGELARTDNSAGFMSTITVAMKLHNLTIQGGAALQVNDTDVSGEHERAVDRQQRKDHLGRARAVDPYLPHLTSPDPLREELELENGDEKAAAKAAQPAWLPLDDPEALVDKQYGQHAEVEARNKATARLKEPREKITDFMGAWGMRRRKAVHWRD